MGAKREYTAIFAIGAKLLGSFRGAMTAAHARLRGLQAAARRVGSSMRMMLGGIAAGFAAFAAGKIFSTIFGTAQEEAVEAEQRTRSLLASLMLIPKYRKAGIAAAQKQLDLIYKHNEALAEQGVLSADMLNNMAVELAQAKLMPGNIQDTVDVMQNLLVKWKGATATEEDATKLANMWRAALVSKRVSLELAKVLGMTRQQVEAFKKMAPQARQDEMMRLGKKVGDLNKAAADTPIGKIQNFHKQMEKMAEFIGGELLPAQGEMAEAWSAALPEIKPLLLATLKGILWAIKEIGVWVRTKLIPWWHEFQKTERFAKLQRVLQWVQDHAKQIAIAIGLIVAALVGFNMLVGLIGIITAIASPVGLVVIGILALVAAFAALYIYWDRLKNIPVLGTILEGYKDSLMVFVNLLIAIGKTIWAVFTGDWAGAAEAWKTVWKSVVDLFNWGKNVIADVFKFIGDAAQKYFVKVLENAKTLWDYILHPGKLFSKDALDAAAAYGQQQGTGGYATGGIVLRPTMAMVGEAGPEAVIPLRGGPASEGLLSYAARSLGMGGTGTSTAMVNFSPVITINGPASEAQQRALDTRLRSLARDFVDEFKRAQAHERRLSYEGGYS